MRELIERIEAATPHHRDRAVDALRALAILGVVLGHWLVTAMVVDSGSVHATSPLQRTPELAPVSWVFQTLAVFFLVGGQVAAKSYESSRARGVTYGRWLGARIARLFRPVAALLVVWTVTAGTMFVSGVGYDNLHALLKLVLSPLWFLLVFAGLTALTPLVARLHPLWPVVVVIHVDIIRLGLDGPARLGWINVAAGWLVPYCLGAAWARGELRSRTTGWTLLIGGATATALLVLLAGYPASMVGVPGSRHLQSRPAHPGRGHLRTRPVRGGTAPVGAAAADPREACRLGGGGAGQPQRHDRLPVAPDGDARGHRDRASHRPHPARTAHPPGRDAVDHRPAPLAAGLRRRPDGVLGGVQNVRTAPARTHHGGAGRTTQ